MTEIDIPDLPEPDRLMSSVMSMAQDAVARVEELRAALAGMLGPWDDLPDPELDNAAAVADADFGSFADIIRAGRAALAKTYGDAA